MLAHQMATVLNPLIESTNCRFAMINRQMNMMVEAFDINDNHVDPIIQQIANQPPPSLLEHKRQERLDLQYGGMHIGWKESGSR